MRLIRNFTGRSRKGRPEKNINILTGHGADLAPPFERPSSSTPRPFWHTISSMKCGYTIITNGRAVALRQTWR